MIACQFFIGSLFEKYIKSTKEKNIKKEKKDEFTRK